MAENQVSEPFLRVRDLQVILKTKNPDAPVVIAFCGICEESMLVFEYKPVCPKCHIPLPVTIMKQKSRS